MFPLLLLLSSANSQDVTVTPTSGAPTSVNIEGNATVQQSPSDKLMVALAGLIVSVSLGVQPFMNRFAMKGQATPIPAETEAKIDKLLEGFGAINERTKIMQREQGFLRKRSALHSGAIAGLMTKAEMNGRADKFRAEIKDLDDEEADDVSEEPAAASVTP